MFCAGGDGDCAGFPFVEHVHESGNGAVSVFVCSGCGDALLAEGSSASSSSGSGIAGFTVMFFAVIVVVVVKGSEYGVAAEEATVYGRGAGGSSNCGPGCGGQTRECPCGCPERCSQHGLVVDYCVCVEKYGDKRGTKQRRKGP